MITKLLIPPNLINETTKNSIETQKEKLKKIWIGENESAIGLERIIRLILVAQPFIFPGIYIRNYLDDNNSIHKKIYIEFYVIFKMFFALFILFIFSEYKAFNINISSFLAIWLSLETILYVLSVIFLEDIHSKPQSFSRSLFLIFINYFEITVWYAVLYKIFQLKPNIGSLEALYFSFTTATTVGFGDLTPYNSPLDGYKNICMTLSMGQMIIMLIFVVLFFNKFVGSINEKKS